MSDRGGASLGTAEGRITVDVGQAIGSLNQLGGALNSFDAKATGVGQTTNQFTQSTVGLAQGMQQIGRVTTGLGVAMAAPFVGAAKAALDFESSMAGINAVMDLTQTQFQDLSDLAQELGKETIFTGTQAAQGIETLGKAGIGFEDIMGGAAQAATDLAAAGGVDIPRAAEVMAAAMQAFNIEGEDSIRVADALAGAANQSLSDVNQLGIGLGQVAGVANAAGLSLEETTAFLAIMADNGIRGSDAATSMKNAILALLAPTDKAAGQLDELGISLLDADRNFIGLAGASQEFFDTWKDSGQTMSEFIKPLEETLGRDAVRTILFGMQAIEDQQKGLTTGLDEYIAAVSEEGAAMEFAQKRMDSTAGAIERLRGSMGVLAETFGKPIIEGIRGPIEGLVEFTNALAEIPTPIAAAVSTLGLLTGGLTAVGGAFLLVGGYVLEAVARFGAAGVTLGRVISILTPIGLTLAAIAAAVAAAQSNFLGFGDALRSIGDFIDKTVKDIKNLTNAFSDTGGFLSDLAGKISGFGHALDVVFGTDLSGFFDRLAAAVDPVATLFENLDQASKVFNLFRKYSALTNGLAQAVEALGDTIDFLSKGLIDVDEQFATAARGIEAFALAFASLQAQGFTGLGSTIAALGIGLQEVFGPNGVTDALLRMASVIESVNEIFKRATAEGWSPAAAALLAIANAAGQFGATGLADALRQAAFAAQTFADEFQRIRDLSLDAGATGLSAVISGIGAALDAVLGTDVSGFFDTIASAINTASVAFQQAIALGINPFEAALIGLEAAIRRLLDADAEAVFDNIGAAIGSASTAVQGLLSAGLDRVVQLFDEIGAALSTADFSGVVAAFGSLGADILAQIQNEVLPAIQSIDIPSITVNVLDWVIEQGTNLIDKIKTALGFADPNGGGSFRGGQAVIDLPQIAANIKDWVVTGAETLAPEVKRKIDEGIAAAGDALGQIPSITVTIGGWIINAAQSLASAIQDFFGLSANSMGGPGERGEAGTASSGLTLEEVLVNIGSWAMGTMGDIGQVAGEIKGWIEEHLTAAAIKIENFTGWSLSLGLPSGGGGEVGGPVGLGGGPGSFGAGSDFGGWIREKLEAAAIKIEDFTGWSLAIGEPGEMSLDFTSIRNAIGAKLRELITVDQGFVDQAGAIGKEIGHDIGVALAAAIDEGVAAAFGGGGAGFPGGSFGAGALDDFLGGGEALSFGDAFANFDQELSDALWAELEPAVHRAFDILGTKVADATEGLWIAEVIQAFHEGQTGIDPFLPDDIFPPNINQSLDEASREAGTQAVETIGRGARGGVEAGIPAIQEDTRSGLQQAVDALWSGITFQEGFRDAGADAAERVSSDVFSPFMDGLAPAIDGELQNIGQPLQEGAQKIGQEVAEAGDDMERAVSEAAQGMHIGEALDTAMSQQIAGVTLTEFTTELGERLQQSIVDGIRGASAEGGGSFRGGTGTLGTTIAESLATSIQGADFTQVGTTIQTKIKEAITTGLSAEGTAEAGGASETLSIGTQIATSLANALMGANFTSVGNAIQVKIAEALSTGLAAEGQAAGAATGGAAAGLGTTIANSLALTISQADFAAVGSAISAKISEALSQGMSGTAPGGGGTGGAAGLQGGANIGSSIAQSLAGQIAQADFSSVGTAISQQIGQSLGTATEGLQSAINAVLGAVVAAGQGAASQAQVVGTAITQAIGSGIGASTGTITAALPAAIQAAISAGTGSAAAANTVGTAITTAVGSGIGAGTGTVTAAIQAMVQAGISGGTSAAAGATAIGEAITTNTGSGVGSGAGTVTAAVQAVVQAAIDAGVAAGAGAARIGENIIAGIVAGINSGAGAVAGAISGIIAAGLAAGEQEAGISSPSKEAIKRIGEPISEGISVGIRNKASGIDKELRRAVTDAFNSIGDVGKEATKLTEISDVLGQMRGADELSSSIGDIGDRLTDASASINDTLSSMVEDMRAKFKEGAKTAKEGADSISRAAASADTRTAAAPAGPEPSRANAKKAKSIVGDLDDMKDDIAKLRELEDMLGQMRGAQELSATVGDIADNIDSGRESATEAAKELNRDLLKEFNEAKKALRKAGKGIGDEVSAGVQEGMKEAATTASSTTDSLTDSITGGLNANLTRLPEMGEAISNALGTGIQEGVTQETPAVMESGARLGEAFGDGIGLTGNNAQAEAAMLVGNANTAIKTATPAGQHVAEESGQTIGQTFALGLREAGNDPEAIIGLVNEFATGIRDQVTNLVPQVQAQGQQLGTAFSTGVDSINPTQSGKSLIDEVGTGISASAPVATKTALDAGTDVGNAVEEGINAGCAPTNEAANELTDSCVPKGLASGLGESTGAANDAGKEISQSLVDGLDIKKKDVENSFDTAGQGFTKALGVGIRNSAGDAVNAAKGVATSAGNVDGRDEGVSVGKSIGQGIADGVTSSIPAIKQAVEEAVDAGIQAAKDKSKSQSPSLVFREIGADWMIGAQLGIESNIYRLENATEQAVGATADIFAGAGIGSVARELDRNLSRYSGKLEQTLLSAQESLAAERLPRVTDNELSAMQRVASGASPRGGDGGQTVNNYTIAGIQVQQGTPEAEAVRVIVNAYQRNSGQYVRQ